MKILEDIIKSIKEDAAVKEVRRGVSWTGVVSKYCGLASTMMYESCAQKNNENLHYMPLTEKTALELAQLVYSNIVSEASLGLAAINSLIYVDESACTEINAGELLVKIGTEKNISVIGHFPFTEELRKVTRHLWVIERRLRPGDYPEDDAKTYIPKSDIIAISSTTFINHTLYNILELCPKNSIKILLGPSTPMSPVLFEYGIDIISGSKVVDTEKALKYIGEGANFRQLKRSGAIKLITMINNNSKIKESV